MKDNNEKIASILWNTVVYSTREAASSTFLKMISDGLVQVEKKNLDKVDNLLRQSVTAAASNSVTAAQRELRSLMVESAVNKQVEEKKEKKEKKPSKEPVQE